VTTVSDAAASDPFGTGLPLDTVVSRPRPDTVLLEVDGEVDTLTAPRLEAGLDAALAAARADDMAVVVDLSGVTFLASSGLAVLIGGARRVSASGRRLHLVAASRAVTRPLEVTGADVLFDIHPDVDAALAAVVAPPPGW
jgi:anti-sigma B factor antagonist